MTKPIHPLANSSLTGILNTYGKETDRIALAIVSFDKEVARRLMSDINKMLAVRQGALF